MTEESVDERQSFVPGMLVKRRTSGLSQYSDDHDKRIYVVIGVHSVLLNKGNSLFSERCVLLSGAGIVFNEWIVYSRYTIVT